MTNATIGGLIKDYRIKKRITQLDVSSQMGWSDTTRLSKIEQGRVSKPSRHTIDKLLVALELDEHEKGDFLFTGGYLPTDEEIKLAINEVKDKIDRWQYPAYLIDVSWRWLYTNLYTLEAVNYPLGWKNKIPKLKPSFLEAAFLPKEQFSIDVLKGEDKENLKPFPIAQIAAFKFENFRFSEERWYKDLIRRLMKYDSFRELWPTITNDAYRKKLFEYEYKILTGMYRGQRRPLDFHVISSRIINNPRFQVVLCYPANQETYDFYTLNSSKSAGRALPITRKKELPQPIQNRPFWDRSVS